MFQRLAGQFGRLGFPDNPKPQAWTAASIILNFAVCRDNAFRQVANSREDPLDLCTASPNFSECRHAEVADQFLIAVLETLRQIPRHVVREDLLTPGMGDADPEHRLPM